MSPTKCASHHFGPWAIEPEWFRQAVASVQAGIIKAESPGTESVGSTPIEVINGVAIIPIEGATMKIRSKFGGTSSVDVRNAVRQAAADESVRGILLNIDSPGGTVAGTDALAQDVAAARKSKPVHAHIEDMGASAAYYVASQAGRISASATSLVGSLGVRMEVIDSQKYFDKAGLVVHAITTGEFKAAGTDGVAITERQLAYFQGIVDDAVNHFKAAVMSGRGFDMTKTDALFDGRVHDAIQAKTLGLIDEVESFDSAMQAILQEIAHMDATQFKAYAAEHPEAVAGFIEQGRTEQRETSKTELKALADASPGRPALAIAAFCSGQPVDAVKAATESMDREAAAVKAAVEAKDKEIARLQFQLDGQGAIGTAGKPKADEKPASNVANVPAEQAKAEWDSTPVLRETFLDEKTFCSFRVAELEGRVKVTKHA